jgi:hypothetical protein
MRKIIAEGTFFFETKESDKIVKVQLIETTKKYILEYLRYKKSLLKALY